MSLSNNGETMSLTPSSSVAVVGSTASGSFDDGVSVLAEKSGSTSTITVAAGDDYGMCTGTYSTYQDTTGDIVLSDKNSGSLTSAAAPASALAVALGVAAIV
eukprot:COSAG02_NODE_3476_length_6675_cov_38.602342_8_plen_102_part_00